MTGDSTLDARQRVTAGNSISIALAVFALVIAAAAFWTARELGHPDDRDLRIEQLSTQVDSLRLLVGEMIDPFGPAPQPGTAAGGTPQPPNQR